MDKNPASADLVTKRRVIAAFQSRLKETMESVLSVESVLTDSSQNDEEVSSDRLGSKREEMMDDVEQHDMIAANAKDRLVALSELTTEEAMDTVDIGALVITDQASFLVCVSLETLEVDGQSYSGVSLQSPVMQEMAGKKAGESVKVNDRTFKIQSVV